MSVFAHFCRTYDLHEIHDNIINLSIIHSAAYEEEILERIVIPLFSNISQETEPNVRTCVGILLLDFSCHCETKRSLELLDIVEKLLNRPFDKFNEENKIILKSDEELKFVSTLVDELIKVIFCCCHLSPLADFFFHIQLLVYIFVFDFFRHFASNYIVYHHHMQ